MGWSWSGLDAWAGMTLEADMGGEPLPTCSASGSQSTLTPAAGRGTRYSFRIVSLWFSGLQDAAQDVLVCVEAGVWWALASGQRAPLQPTLVLGGSGKAKERADGVQMS